MTGRKKLITRTGRFSKKTGEHFDASMNFPANPLLQLVPSRLPQALARVRAMVWKKVVSVTSIDATECSPVHVGFADAKKQKLSPLGTLPVHYGKLWDQRWFRLRLPKLAESDGPFYLRWNDQAEATLYVDGVPHYGFDVAHHYAPLPAAVREVWVESVVCQTGIWHPQATGLDPLGSRFNGAEIFSRHELAWNVLHDFLVLEDLMREELRAAFPAREGEFGAIGTKPVLGLLPPLLRRLLRFLDDAVNALDANGLAAAQRVLGMAFRELKSTESVPRAVLTGHAHIDLVWLWPERVGEFKAVHTFATANRMMEHYPEFRFAYSQPASYEAVQRISPAMSEAVRERIRQGRWEAHGATYVESDTLLACGEALARSFLIGQSGFEEITGKPSPILWLPDVFGYSGCLPQLMRETGAQFFFTTKLSWNAITPFPHSSFVWAGADGSSVVAHLCQNNGYNQTVSAGELRRGAAAHRQCDVHPEFLAPTGFGDGGGGVTEEMCERAKRCASLAGVPNTTWGSLRPFFQRLHAIKDRLPVYRGELYFEYHRGTYTTHGDVKAAMRAAERALQIREAAHCAMGTGPVPVQPWKRVVFAQFHDYIPGSSIHEVYDEAKNELGAIAAESLQAAGELLSSARIKTPAIFNPLPHPVLHSIDSQTYVLPPLAGRALASLETMETPAVVASANSLENGRVRARFDKFGRITSLAIDGESIPFALPANEFVLYPEHPHHFAAWDIDRQALSLGRADKRPAKVVVRGADVSFTRPLGKTSSVTVRYSLDPGSCALRIAYDLDWHEEHTLLKAHFPTQFVGHDARFGAPFGSVRRPQLGGSLSAEAVWEAPASRWVVVADDSESEGFYVVTEAKFGFSCRDGNLGLSLVRSAKITSEERGNRAGSHPEPLRRTLAPHIVSDIGAHHIEIAVGRFDPGAPRQEHPAALAEILFTKPLAYHGAECDCGFLGLDGGDSLQPVWARPLTADRWVLRLHETLGRSGVARLALAPGWNARRVDLSGNPVGRARSLKRIEFSPYKIISIEIQRA
jgi:alpha-mannosidase